MGAPRARRSGRRGATLTVSTVPTKLARQEIASLRDKPRAVTAQFLAGGVLGVIGAWLADQAGLWSLDQLVETLIQCLPGWLNSD
jgi:hypothetical protein